MAKFERVDRLGEEMRREIDRIIREEIKDPRVTGLYSVTALETTRELASAKVRVSVMADPEAQKALIEALNRASGYVRRELGRRLTVRAVPEISFVLDEGIAYGVNLSKRIDDVVRQDEARRQDP